MMEDLVLSDIIYMKNLVGRTVMIETVDNQTHTGTVYVLDPVYKTIVLINNSNCLELILHRGMKSFNILPEVQHEDFLQKNESCAFSSEDLEQKKLTLVKWLKHMFIDVREDGEFLRVEDHLIIGSPYGKTECMCDNTIVLERVQNIIDLMPEEFK